MLNIEKYRCEKRDEERNTFKKREGEKDQERKIDKDRENVREKGLERQRVLYLKRKETGKKKTAILLVG